MGESVWSDEEYEAVLIDQMKQRIQSDGELLATMATTEEIKRGWKDIVFITRFHEAGGDNHSGTSWAAVCGLALKILDAKSE